MCILLYNKFKLDEKGQKVQLRDKLDEPVYEMEEVGQQERTASELSRTGGIAYADTRVQTFIYYVKGQIIELERMTNA